MTYSPSIMRKLTEWHHSPLLFATECMNFNPSTQQAELLKSVATEKRVTIRSGHGTGKDASVGGVVIPWFLATRPYSKVVCTAPTARQLADILWSEIAKWLRRSRISEEFIIQKDKIFHKDAPKEWWCRAVSPSVKASKEEQAETLAGFHGDHLLIVVDEASGVPDPVYIPLEGALTQEDNRVILIGNMTRNVGYFYDTHFHVEIKKKWYKLHWNSETSTNVKPEYCEYMRTKYGVESNVYRIRVQGEPPLADDDVFIPLAAAEMCIGNDVSVPEDEPLYLGVDVARYGSDASIVLPRIGNIIKPWREFRGMNTIDLAGFVAVQYTELEAMGVAVDEIGIGAGVVDWLMKKQMPGLFGVNVATSSSDVTRFNRLRDELWYRVREKCLTAKYCFPTDKRPGEVLSLGQELANELSSPLYKFNSHGGYVIEKKEDMKLRGIMSPNIADALCLSEYFSNVATQVFRPKFVDSNDRVRPGAKNKLDELGPYSWMVA